MSVASSQYQSVLFCFPVHSVWFTCVVTCLKFLPVFEMGMWKYYGQHSPDVWPWPFSWVILRLHLCRFCLNSFSCMRKVMLMFQIIKLSMQGPLLYGFSDLNLLPGYILSNSIHSSTLIGHLLLLMKASDIWCATELVKMQSLLAVT